MDDPHCAVLFNGCVDGCLPSCFGHGFHMRGVGVVGRIDSGEGVGDGVVVDDDVAWLFMLCHVGGFACCWWAGDDVDFRHVSPPPS